MAGVFASAKRRGKRKTRPAAPAGKVLKGSGKGKAKSRRGVSAVEEAPSSAPLAAAVGTLAHGVMTALGKKPAMHKLVRRPGRLGPLERLEAAVEEVRLGGRTSPRTRKLQMSGVPKMAQKVIEEAGECAIEAVQGDGSALVNETVDLLYNVVVLLGSMRIPLSDVWAEMERREVAFGMAEKLPKAVDPDV